MSRQRGRDVNGILLLDKPTQLTSNAALQIVKRLYNAKKAGHTGSLDPIANGLLPICFGEATKFSQFLLESDKQYQVTAKLGVRTITGDSEGDTLYEKSPQGITAEQIKEILPYFRGLIHQMPPMFSAIKYNGKPLYELARQGIEVERKSRCITIYELALTDFNHDYFSIHVTCSKGTYIRTLIDDMGEMLGCGAHVISLKRSAVGPYSSEQMVSLDVLETIVKEKGPASLDHYLLPVDSSVASWNEVRLSESVAYYLRQGQPVIIPRAPSSGWVKMTLHNGNFLGVGEVLDDGRVAPRRLIAL